MRTQQNGWEKPRMGLWSQEPHEGTENAMFSTNFGQWERKKFELGPSGNRLSTAGNCAVSDSFCGWHCAYSLRYSWNPIL